MIEQIKSILVEVRLRTVILAVGILLTFGLIAAAAPNLPNNAETLVTEAMPLNEDGLQEDRNDGRQNRLSRSERPDEMIDEVIDGLLEL